MRRNLSSSAKAVVFLALCACVPALEQQEPREADKNTPETFGQPGAGESAANKSWREFFTDPVLVALIDTALTNNQELNIALQEIYIANTEVLARSGEYLPNLGVGVGAEIEKPGRYTSKGAYEEGHTIEPGKRFPDPLPNFFFGFRASWEVDIWKRLRNATKAASLRYFASVEGRNFMATSLIAEIATTYYELLSLDNQLEVLKQNIALQQNGLELVRLEKQSARVTELAVKRFEAEVFKNQSHQFEIQQQIVEAENRLNFLVGRFPQHIERNATGFVDLKPAPLGVGVPTDLLQNRPDVRQAELNLQAAKLDVDVARALFYPSLSIDASLGYDAYNLKRLITTPESIVYNLSGNILAPLLNRRAIKAQYFAANAKQMQAVVQYEKTVLEAYAEAANQLAMIDNLTNSVSLRTQQVGALTESIEISTTLFTSARADYLEVLTTRRDALESQMELIETKKKQLTAAVNVYQALGGGWREAFPEPPKQN